MNTVIPDEEFIGKVFPSNNYGDFIVLENCGKKPGQVHDRYKVQFLFSKGIAYATKCHILNGEVGDRQNYGLDVSQLQYSNNYGPFRIIEFIKSPINNGRGVTVRLQFTNTGTEVICGLDDVKSGMIKDPNATEQHTLNMSILPPHIWEYRINIKLYRIYNNIKRRCLKEDVDCYKFYGGIGISMCERWFNSSATFVQDARFIPQFDKFYRFPDLYQLDKDLKQLNTPKEQRIYAPETCMFLHYHDNANVRAYEYNRDNQDKLTSRYYGVVKEAENRYRTGITVNGKQMVLGRFSNEIAAASCYNYWHRKYHQYELFPLFNQIDEMPPEEFIKYNNNPKLLYKVISNDKNIEEVLQLWQ